MRSLAFAVQILESEPKDARGKPRRLSHSEAAALTLMFLRRGLTFDSLAAFASVSVTTVTDVVQRTLDSFEKCVTK